MNRTTAIACGLWLVCLGLSRCTAQADDGLLLARVCMSEADLHPGNDCAAIAEVTRYRAALTGRTIREQLRAYSPQATGARPTQRARQRWISRLSPDATRPAHFPAHLRWEPYRSGWLRRLEEARELLRRPRRVCATPPAHWGMRTGREYWGRLHIGWREVACGATRNAFWVVR